MKFDNFNNNSNTPTLTTSSIYLTTHVCLSSASNLSLTSFIEILDYLKHFSNSILYIHSSSASQYEFVRESLIKEFLACIFFTIHALFWNILDVLYKLIRIVDPFLNYWPRGEINVFSDTRLLTWQNPAVKPNIDWFWVAKEVIQLNSRHLSPFSNIWDEGLQNIWRA
jgi:hypothetical protein